MAAYGYVRVSSAEQAGDDRTSLDTQRRKVAAVGELAGLRVARVFEEPGVSGGTALADRPGGRELLAVLRPGDTVIVAKLDRAGSGKNLGRYAASWIACWPKRPSSTAART